MLKAIYLNPFKKSIKKMEKRGKDIEKIKVIIALLILEKPLDKKHNNHKLHGKFKDYWECHVEPNWLLVYKKNKVEIIFADTGSHSDLF